MEPILQYGGWIGTLLGIFTTAYATMRKSNVDESSHALDAWKEITDRHDREIMELRRLLTESNDDRERLRRRVVEVEDSSYDERREFRREIETLHRQILQLHTSYLAQMTILADPDNPDHAKLLTRATALLEQASKAYSNYDQTPPV